MTENNCNKYEYYYTFRSEEDFFAHLETCPECQKEHAQMQKISSLVKEVAPFVKQKKRNNLVPLKAVAVIMVAALAFFGAQPFMVKNEYNLLEVSLTKDSSTIEEMGLPTDNYGLLMVE